MIRSLGIDPGLRRTGWAVLDSHASRFVAVATGSLATSEKDDLARRLERLHTGLLTVIEDHRPTRAAMEDVFVHKDPRAAFALGQAQGALLSAIGAAGLELDTFAPNTVKNAVTGKGHASKEAVGFMVARLTSGAKPESEHAADALAVALCAVLRRPIRGQGA